ncbi:hypothetical protein GF385_03010 [Candidatus Dependentiae bacterium]|nr:hypothetical protein [Candidatus Dependentiae bacterium]
MKIINNIIKYIQKLNKKDLEKNLILILVIIAFSSLGITYFIYTKSNSLIQKIKSTKKLTFKTQNIIETHLKMQKEEEKLQKILEKEGDFNIQTYFEKFCASLNITPEGNWETLTQELPGSDKFDEVSLNATFKNQTTKKLIEILEELNKKDIVYIKELIIKNENNKKIMFDIIIANKKLKKSI